MSEQESGGSAGVPAGGTSTLAAGGASATAGQGAHPTGSQGRMQTAAEGRAERILAQMGDALVVVDCDFRVVDVNPAAERILGTPRDALLGRTHWEAFPGSVGAEPERQYRRVQAEGVEAHFTHHYVDAGRDFHADVDAYPTDEGEGAGRGVAIFWRDVTARVQAAAALRASEARLRAVVAHVQDYAISGLDAEGRVTEWTAGAERVKGYAAAEVVGRHVSTFHTPEDVAAGGPARELAEAAATGRAEREGWRVRKGGARFWAHEIATAVRDADGRVVGFTIICRDLTERRRGDEALRDSLAATEAARAALAESEAKFRFALAVADLGAWDLDLATQRAWRSPRHDQIFGYDAPLAEWTYEQFLGHVVPEERARVDAAFGGALAAAAPWDFTCRIRRADGAERWIAARGEPIADAAGTPVRLVGVVGDVTAAREAEAALRAAVANAEAANRAKGEFLAVMSHELRTPLNAIGGYAELMELGIRGPITAQQREDLGRIQRSQRHLLGLVNEVLNYARLETGAVQYDLRTVRVRDAVTEAEGLILPQAGAKGLALVVADCPDHLAVRADPEKLRQVLVNLLSNAIKFTDARDGLPGRVEVTCGTSPDGRVQVRVRDTGIGIPADKLETIFEPFVQVRSDLTRTQEGTGLGLAISRDLARGMGGDLTAESTPGVGSTFTLTMPPA